jgi:predicted helicase
MITFLKKLKLLFQELLLPDLDNHNFADMYAQTIAYGLFTARIGHFEKTDSLTPNPSPRVEGSNVFNRKNASNYITNKIPFLQGLFKTVIETDIIAKINWSIDNLVELLAKVDMSNILENFGQKTRREDPVIHFYETFLAAYQASLRKSRGVYYTPEPVVDFIVKTINHILDQDFDVQDGLGHRNVRILDPATGTGTFLYQVIKQIYLNFQKYGVNRWEKLLRDRQVLKRLYGFEILMTPYTIAHLKLGLLLESLGYHFQDNERLNIFLTNTLEKGVKKSEFLLGKYIAEEGNQAAKIKSETLIDVVLGNPPYSGHSENKNEWIDGLIRDYYQIDGVSLDEKNPKWLQDDYVKFIRFGQWKIDQTGCGILGFVTNHGYLDNPTFRGMRQNLLQSFNRLYIVNLHGNTKKKEVSPDGSADQNVFDIQQGVSILIAIKDTDRKDPLFNRRGKLPPNGVYYYDIWGSREEKYRLLQELNIETMTWEKVNPVSPFYLFIPQNTELQEEYNQGWKITEIMPINSVGIVTARDSLTIQNTLQEVQNLVNDFVSLSEEEARKKYNLGRDSKDWSISLAQNDLRQSGLKNELITPILYRPFDIKYTYYTGNSRGFICRTRNEVMKNMLRGDNLALVTVRKMPPSSNCGYFLATKYMVSNGAIRSDNQSIDTVFPLYIYPDTENGQDNLVKEKQANFSPEFLTAITEKLGYQPTPENIFYYIYAVCHSPEYRYRYEPFLKIDFPRIPLTSNNELFTQLVTKGEELVNLHLLKKLPDISITKSETLATVDLPLFQEKGSIHYQGDGENEISQVNYNSNQQKVIINKDCYFTGISEEVWNFKIGGYQVLDKWLKDRKKTKPKLSSDEITHYQQIVIVLQETIKLMTEIDQIIGKFPLK